MRIQIDAKNWAELKPIEDLTRKDRTAVNAVVLYELDPENSHPIFHGDSDDNMVGALLGRICMDWSLPFLNPVTDPSSLDKLTLEQDDALREACAPYLAAIRGRNAPSQENAVPTAGSGS